MCRWSHPGGRTPLIEKVNEMVECEVAFALRAATPSYYRLARTAVPVPGTRQLLDLIDEMRETIWGSSP